MKLLLHDVRGTASDELHSKVAAGGSTECRRLDHQHIARVFFLKPGCLGAWQTGLGTRGFRSGLFCRPRGCSVERLSRWLLMMVCNEPAHDQLMFAHGGERSDATRPNT